MKTVALLLTVLGAAAAFSADSFSLVPLPASIQPEEGSFAFSVATGIRYNKKLANEAGLIAKDLEALTGREPVMATKEQRSMIQSQILLDLDPASELPASGYRMEISQKGIRITGKDAAGAFYGTRTLLQLLPAGKLQGTTEIPAMKISDHPRFGWRGMMLDSGRHFIPVEDVKSFINWLAFHKLNTLHWHLSEDQGWRIEIKKYPKLTEVGAYRDSTPPYGDRNGSDGKRYGDFYTQEQIKDIVAFATARHVTIVPEIDMPGHMAAAIAAYPNLGNDDIPNYNPKVETHWGVHPYTLAPTEEVFQFVDDVFTEICALFPSPYIHMGGDEAPKNQWNQSPRVKSLMGKEKLKDAHDVQSYFVKRVEKILEAKGRKLIGWDEIREGGLSPKATVMSWRGEAGGIASAREGHDVVMSPNSHMYFDHYQAPAAGELAKGAEFEAIGGFLPIDKVYSYDPIPTDLSEDEAKHVLGVQANLWSEYFKDYKKVEYFAFPRIAAISEVAWTSKEQKNYRGFVKRLDGILKHYDAAGVNRGKVYIAPEKKTKDGSTVDTSLGNHAENWAELAFDGRADTFFWANRELGIDDHFILHLKSALDKESTVTINSGGSASQNGDRLEKGVLEASTDGSAWKEIATFKDGKATGKAPGGTAHLRIRVTAPQKNWLILDEITID